MNTARSRPARLRGVLVGASSGAVAVAAHGVGGADLPASPSIVVMLLLCAVVGAAASSPAETHRRLPAVLAYVVAGQLVGHYALVLASTHTHGNHWSAPMLASHLVAAVVCAALICMAERLFGALASALWRLILALLVLRGGDHPRPSIRTRSQSGLTARVLASRGLGTRGPPVPATAA